MIVIGGGPAGSAAAILLARGGVDVTLVEASRYESFRVGETLPPRSRILLSRLGVLDRYLDDGHISSPGTVSVWGSNEPRHNDFVFNPYGVGWHLDRSRFDTMLAQAAADAGAVVMPGCRVRNSKFDDAWRVEALTKSVQFTLQGQFIIDATGRFGWTGRLAKPRRIFDRLVAAVWLSRLNDLSSFTDGRTLVEAVSNGWWYSSPIPGDWMVTAFFSDSDLVPSGKHGSKDLWKRWLARAPNTENRL